MALNNLDLAALVSSRICHDLISPIGAINNGLELLNMSGLVHDGPEIQLIGDSVKSASARIRFFRIAVGAASEDVIGQTEVVSILDDMFDSGRLTVAWKPVDGQMRKSVRRAFLAIKCLESAMPYGGQINVSSSRTSRKISGQADKLGEFELVWNEPTSTKISAAHVQFVLLKNALLTDSLEIHVTQTSNEITIQF